MITKDEIKVMANEADARMQESCVADAILRFAQVAARAAEAEAMLKTKAWQASVKRFEDAMKERDTQKRPVARRVKRKARR